MSTNSEKATFIQVLEEHKNMIFKVSRSYAYTREDREDLFQDIAVQLWKSFNRYNDQYKYSTWIYRIALNVAISFTRKKNRSGTRVELDANLLTQSEETEGNEEDVERLYSIIGNLKPMDKALMILYLEEKSHKEMAAILGISETNVATKLYRLKQELQKQFVQKNT